MDLALREARERLAGELIADPVRLLYHPDTFRWLIGEVAQGSPQWTVQVEGGRGHLPVAWTPTCAGAEAPASVYFGFEPGENWKRWTSILNEVQDRCLPPPLTPSGTGRLLVHAKAVFLRTPEQATIPGPGWEIGGEWQSAKRTCLDLVVLDTRTVAEIYAGYAMYLDAVAGDLPYSTGQILGFLRADMQPLWLRILEAMSGEPEPALGEALAGVSR